MQTDNQLHEVENKLIAQLDENINSAPLPASFDKDKHIRYPNAHFDTPNAHPWLSIAIINNGVIDQDASGCYEINSGFFIVSVFYEKGKGSQDPLKVAHAIKGLYTGEIFDDVTIERVAVNPLPENEADAWYQINVQVDFTFEGYTS